MDRFKMLPSYHYEDNTDGVINNPAELALRDYIIEGNCGKNLIPYPYRDSVKTVNGVTFTDDGNGSVTVSGTPTDTATFTFTKSPIPVTGGTTYTISMNAENASNIDFRLNIYNISGSLIKSEITTASTYAITLPDAATGITIYMSRTNINQECTGVFRPQLELGETATEYERYKEVGNESVNLIPYPFFSGTVTSNGITFTDNEDGSVTINGTATVATVYAVRHKLEYWVVPKGIYTLSGSPAQTDGNKVSMIFVPYKGNEIAAQFYESGSSKLVDITEVDYDAITIFISVPKGRTCDNLVFKPQLELGEIATPYIPYGKYNIPITVSGKNLFDCNNASYFIGYFTRVITTIKTHNNARTIYIPCEPNTTYTISRNTSYSNFHFGYTTELPAVGVEVYGAKTDDTQGKAKSLTITTGADAKYLVSYIYNGYAQEGSSGGWESIIDGIQIEKGTTATDYEPYIEPRTTNILLDSPLGPGESISKKADDLPEIMLNKGSNIITVDTEVKPKTTIYQYYTY